MKVILFILFLSVSFIMGCGFQDYISYSMIAPEITVYAGGTALDNDTKYINTISASRFSTNSLMIYTLAPNINIINHINDSNYVKLIEKKTVHNIDSTIKLLLTNKVSYFDSNKVHHQLIGDYFKKNNSFLYKIYHYQNIFNDDLNTIFSNTYNKYILVVKYIYSDDYNKFLANAYGPHKLGQIITYKSDLYLSLVEVSSGTVNYLIHISEFSWLPFPANSFIERKDIPIRMTYYALKPLLQKIGKLDYRINKNTGVPEIKKH